MPVKPSAGPRTASPYIAPNIYSDVADETKDTPATPGPPRPDSALASGRRSTGGAPAGRIPLDRIPFNALQLVGRHLPPAAAAQYSLMSKPLHDAWYPEAKEAVKKMLKAELKHLCMLAYTDADKKVNALAAEALLKAVEKLPAADQVEVLAHTLETICYRDKNNRHVNNTVSALKKVHCMKLLAQAAMKLEHDDALQMVALKCLTTHMYLHDDTKDQDLDIELKSPWDSIDLVTQFDFAQRAVVAGDPSLFEALSCFSVLIMGIRDEFWVGSDSGDEVSEMEDAYQDIDLEIIDQKVNSLLNLIAQQIVAKPAATLACEFGYEDKDAGIKDLFFLIASRIIANLQQNKSENNFKFQIKLMQAYAKVIDKDSSSSGMVTLGGREMPIDKAFAQLFFGLKIQASDSGLSQSEATSENNEVLDYVAAMDIGWFPREERQQRLKEVFEFIRDISENKRLSIGAYLRIMPNQGEFFEKFESTPEYKNVLGEEATNEATEVTHARQLLVEVTDNLKQHITSRLEEFSQKPYLEGEDVDDLVALFKMSPDALGDTTVKTLRQQLVELLFKVQERDYSKLAPLMKEIIVPGASSVDRKYQLDQLTHLVEKAIHSNTMGFHEGAQLLVNLDSKIKEYSGAYTENRPVEKVNALMTEHLKRRDFGMVSDFSDEENIDYGCYAERIFFETRYNNDYVGEKKYAATKEKTDSILKKYIPETDSKGMPHPPNRRLVRAMTDDEALVLEKAGLLSLSLTTGEEEKNQSFRLFVEGALPPEQFMKNMYIWSDELKQLEDLPRLNALVNAADNLEQTHAADIEGGKISPALVFNMTQGLLHIAKQQPDDVPGRDSKAKVIAQIHAIEDRHIARLGGEKRDRVAEAVVEAQEAAEQAAAVEQMLAQHEARMVERQQPHSARLAFSQDLQMDEDDDSDEDMPAV
jgi:hypothetical protein